MGRVGFNDWMGIVNAVNTQQNNNEKRQENKISLEEKQMGLDAAKTEKADTEAYEGGLDYMQEQVGLRKAEQGENYQPDYDSIKKPEGVKQSQWSAIVNGQRDEYGKSEEFKTKVFEANTASAKQQLERGAKAFQIADLDIRNAYALNADGTKTVDKARYQAGVQKMIGAYDEVKNGITISDVNFTDGTMKVTNVFDNTTSTVPMLSVQEMQDYVSQVQQDPSEYMNENFMTSRMATKYNNEQPETEYTNKQTNQHAVVRENLLDANGNIDPNERYTLVSIVNSDGTIAETKALKTDEEKTQFKAQWHTDEKAAEKTKTSLDNKKTESQIGLNNANAKKANQEAIHYKAKIKSARAATKDPKLQAKLDAFEKFIGDKDFTDEYDMKQIRAMHKELGLNLLVDNKESSGQYAQYESALAKKFPDAKDGTEKFAGKLKFKKVAGSWTYTED